jgi:hypothetical protein
VRPERPAASSSSNPRIEVNRSTDVHDIRQPVCCWIGGETESSSEFGQIGLTGCGAGVCLKDATGSYRATPSGRLSPWQGMRYSHFSLEKFRARPSTTTDRPPRTSPSVWRLIHWGCPMMQWQTPRQRIPFLRSKSREEGGLHSAHYGEGESMGEQIAAPPNVPTTAPTCAREQSADQRTCRRTHRWRLPNIRSGCAQ